MATRHTMLDINFNPFPEIITDRLRLRQFITTDADDLFMLRSDKTIMRFIPRPLAQSRSDSEQLIRRFTDDVQANEAITWAICFKDEKEVIGTIGFVKIGKPNFRAEIGYLLNTPYQGKGIMIEALSSVVKYGFETMKLHSIEAVVHPDNKASVKVLLNNGFIREASFKDYQFFNGKFLDADVYSRISGIPSTTFHA
jgi:ribosomal-protein-alanine N-acetyltransferase